MIRIEYMEINVPARGQGKGLLRMRVPWSGTRYIGPRKAHLLRALLAAHFPNPRDKEIKRIGTLLSNIAYNAAQRSDVPEDLRKSMDEVRRQWDALFIRTLAPAAPERNAAA